jgi:hypothetical protein
MQIKIPNPEIRRTLMICTSHIPCKDDKILRRQAEDNSHPEGLFSVDIPNEHCYEVCIPQDETDAEDVAGALRNEELSEDFERLFRIAMELGVDALRFDHDGPEFDELPMHSW